MVEYIHITRYKQRVGNVVEKAEKGIYVVKVMAEIGFQNRTLLLLMQSLVMVVLDYGSIGSVSDPDIRAGKSLEGGHVGSLGMRQGFSCRDCGGTYWGYAVSGHDTSAG